MEGEFLNAAPSRFRTVKLREAHPVTLQLNATLKLPAEQIARALEQSLGADSPYQSSLSGVYLALSPQATEYSGRLNLVWEITGFKGRLPAFHLWEAPAQPQFLARSSELNGCAAELKQEGYDRIKGFRLMLPHSLCGKQVHFEETLSFLFFEGGERSDILPIDASQRSTYLVDGHEYTACLESRDEHQGVTITGLGSNEALVDLVFFNAQGEEIQKYITSAGGGSKGVFFGFQEEQPAAFQIKYQTKPQTLSLPCRFSIPLPECVVEM